MYNILSFISFIQKFQKLELHNDVSLDKTTMDVPEENQDDWVAECSDDENYKLTPTDIIELYQRIGRGENLELEWKCPGRRSPTPERNEENVAIKEEVDGESITEHRFLLIESYSN